MKAITQTKATSQTQLNPAMQAITPAEANSQIQTIKNKNVFAIQEAINKSQAIVDLLSTRKLEVFCLPDSDDESVGLLIDVNDSCKRILD